MHKHRHGVVSDQMASTRSTRGDFSVSTKRIPDGPVWICHRDTCDDEGVGIENDLIPARIVTALLQQSVPVRLVVGGPSMRPFLHDGDEVTVQPLSCVTPQRGHIVLFRQHGRLTLHRFIQREPNGRWRMVADAALEGAELIEPTDALGVAVLRQRQERTQNLDGWIPRSVGLLCYTSRPVRRWLIRIWSATRRWKRASAIGQSTRPARVQRRGCG